MCDLFKRLHVVVSTNDNFLCKRFPRNKLISLYNTLYFTKKIFFLYDENKEKIFFHKSIEMKKNYYYNWLMRNKFSHE